MEHPKIGILPQDKMRERALAIARGEYKPKADEPKIWFTSMESLIQALRDDDHPMLRSVRGAQ